jgi:hypothetical protein
MIISPNSGMKYAKLIENGIEATTKVKFNILTLFHMQLVTWCYIFIRTDMGTKSPA